MVYQECTYICVLFLSKKGKGKRANINLNLLKLKALRVGAEGRFRLSLW